MSVQFQTDLMAWRKSRPEYKKLLVAIRAREADEKLVALAGDAGESAQFITDMVNLRNRASAPHMKKRAESFAKTKKEFDDLIEKIGETEKCLDLSKSQMERDRFEGELYEQLDRRQILNMSLADSQVAAACVDAAKEAGVL